MTGMSDEEFVAFKGAESSGAWRPPGEDVLTDLGFREVGYHGFELASEAGWRLELSHIEVSGHSAVGIVSLYADGDPAALPGLDGLVIARATNLLGGRGTKELADEIEDRLGDRADQWVRRIEFLCASARFALRRGPGDLLRIEGPVPRPSAVPEVFRNRLREGRSISIYGPGGSGKTTIVEGLAVSLTTGLTVVPDWEPTRRFRVLVLDWDEGHEETLVRLHAISRGVGADPVGYHYLAMTGPLVDAADELGRIIAEERIEVVIVSPMNRALREAAGDPGRPVFDLHDVLRALRVTSILVDHVAGSQVQRSDAARAYGSVGKRDAVRGSCSIYEQSASDGCRVIVMRNTKPDALAPRRPPQAIRIEYSPATPVDGIYDTITFHEDVVRGDAAVADANAPPRPPARWKRLVAILRDHGPLTTEECEELGPFPHGSVSEAAKEARANGVQVNFDRGVGRWSVDGEAESSAGP